MFCAQKTLSRASRPTSPGEGSLACRASLEWCGRRVPSHSTVAVPAALMASSILGIAKQANASSQKAS